MVRRSTNEPRTALERTVDNSRQLAELARAQGRGTTALRDESGNTLVMNPAAPYPLLRPQGVDASVAFDPTTNEVKMVSPDTNEDRDMTVRDITSSGNVYANQLSATGDMTAVNFRATGQTTCNNLGANSANIGPLTAGQTTLGNLICSQINSGDIFAPGHNINTDPPGGGVGSVRSANFIGGTFTGHGAFDNNYLTSDERLKRDFREVADSDVNTLLATPVRRWRWDEGSDGDDGREHVGPAAQDMPDIARVEIHDGNLAIDQATYSGLLLALCQRQQQQIDSLFARVTKLEGDRAGQGEPGA